MRVGLGHHAVIVRGAQHQRVVGGAVELGFDLLDRVRQLIARSAVHLRDRANAQGILRANAFALGDHFAAVEQGTQVDPDLLHARVRLECDDLSIKRVNLPALGFEAHGADHVGPVQQARGVGDGQAAQAAHARRAVDQAQTVFGAEFYRLQAFFSQRLLSRYDLPAIADIAHAQQRDADVRHVSQITHRTLGRHLRGDAPVEQRQQRFDDLTVQAGFAVAVVDDGGAHDRAGLLVGQWRANATGVAEQGVARQLAELFVLQRDVAQRAQAGVDAVGTFAAGDDALDDGLRVFDARPDRCRQLKLCAIAGHGDHVLPSDLRFGDNDFFSLGHL
ncbi:hypothetical protein D3C71_1317810 [compost metagenome]